MTTLSLITVVCNGASVIRDCLVSVAGQSSPCEHIVIDGASTDGSLEVIRQFPHVARVLSEPDKGIYDAMNKGIGLATGDVVGILNADDVYASPQVLEKVMRVFDDPHVEACYGDLVYIGERAGSKEIISAQWRDCEGERSYDNSLSRDHSASPGFDIVRCWKSGPYDPRKFYWGWMPPHPTFFVRRSNYKKYGAFNLELGSAADYELMLRFLLKHRVTAAYIPEVLVHMRTGGVSNASLKNRLRANRMDRLAWKVNGLRPYPWTLICKPLRKVGQWVWRQ